MNPSENKPVKPFRPLSYAEWRRRVRTIHRAHTTGFEVMIAMHRRYNDDLAAKHGERKSFDAERDVVSKLRVLVAQSDK